MFSPVPSRGTNVARGDCADVWIGPLENQRWRRNARMQCDVSAARAQSARTSLTIQGNDLSDWRGARRAMRCYEVLSVEELERRAVARDLVRGRNQITRRIGESRSVQHLANVASRLGTLGVMVQKCEAGDDVEQHDAAKNCEDLAGQLRLEDSGCRETPHLQSNSGDTHSTKLRRMAERNGCCFS
jgi:hypothetical protein